jgi:predicted HAD superfamily Cof-like phosphohydrolase
MNQNREELVAEQHRAFAQEINAVPTVKLVTLRKALVVEESKEFIAELDTALAHLEKGEDVPKEVWANMLKEAADLQVVLSGTIVALAPLQKFDEAFMRVHASNMSKLGPDGKPILREDGKYLKGPNYFKADLSDLV